MYINRIHYSLSLCALLAAGMSHAGTIESTVTNGSAPNSLRATFNVSGFSLAVNQELDILFAPALFSLLLNGNAGPGFDVQLFQPDNPPGTFGHFSALALVDHAAISSPLSVDFFFIGPGRPGSLPFFINQYDQTGAFVTTIQSGLVSNSQGVPEPGGLWLVGMVFAVAGAGWAVRRRFVRAV